MAISMAILSCKQEAKEESQTEVEITDASMYESFGEEISPEAALSTEEMKKIYETLEVGDSIGVKFTGSVKSVCQAKGCWMKLDLGDSETESFVRFKDYDFFVPKDIAESDAIVEGKAYKEEMTVEDQQHYAKDAGKSEEEIAAITESKMVYNFEAEGVLIK